MRDQLRDVIELFNKADGKKVIEEVTSPAQRHLREVNPDCNPLSTEKSQSFHTIVASLLWIMKRARPDLETSVGFLCTRVSKSDEDDWKKLRRVIAYVQATINDIRIIGASSLSDIFTWIDAAYAVTDDMKNQTGGTMSFVIDVLHAKSGKKI